MNLDKINPNSLKCNQTPQCPASSKQKLMVQKESLIISIQLRFPSAQSHGDGKKTSYLCWLSLVCVGLIDGGGFQFFSSQLLSFTPG